MKYLYVIPVLLFFVLNSCSQFNLGHNEELSKLSAKVDSLSSKVDSLTKQNKRLENEISWLELEMGLLNKSKESKLAAPVTIAKPVSKTVATPVAKPAASPAASPIASPKAEQKASQDWQCQAITSSGKRCSRPVVQGSKYCSFHKEIYEPEIPIKK